MKDRLTIRLSQKLMARLIEASQEQKITKSDLVRLILENRLLKQPC